MRTAIGNGRRTARSGLVALVVGFLALGAALIPTQAAHGEGGGATSVVGATFDWKVSTYVLTSSSLAPHGAAGAPATYDATTGWHFTGGTGTYDSSTGALSLAFTGSMTFGNQNQGGYGIRFLDPVLTIAGGTGTITADVSIRPSGGTAGTFGTPVADVTVAEFSASTTSLGGHVQLTITPDFDVSDLQLPNAQTGAVPTYEQRQFPQSLIDTVGTSLRGHFRQTGAPTASASDLNKPPVAFTVGFWVPGVGVTPTTDIAYEGGTVTVSGSGIDPAANVYPDGALAGQPSGIEVAFGRFAESWQPSAGAPDTAREVLVSKRVVPAATRTALENLGVPSDSLATLNEDGTFETTLDIAPGGTSSGTYGVASYANGGTPNASHEFLTPVTFAAEVTTTTTTAPPTTTTTTPSGSDPGDDNAVVGGFLDWGMKASFRNYIQTVAAGTITTGDGATTNADGTFHFPLDAEGDEYDDGDLDAAFLGSVHFTGHSGALDLTVSDLRIEADGTSGVLIADLSSLPNEPGATPEVFDDVELVALDLSGSGPVVVGESLVWTDIASVLTDDGAEAFASFYTAGTAFDAADVTLEFEDTPDGSAGGGGPTATLSKTTVAPGESLTVSGGGFTPGEQTEVWVHSDPVFVGATKADADGDVVYTFVVPDLPPGQHQVEIRGISSGRSVWSAYFTVTSGGAAGGKGGQLAFTGANGSTTNLAMVGSALVLLGGGALVVAARQRRKLAMAEVEHG